MILGIILAAGKGTRMNSHESNKVVMPFSGRPMIQYGAELFQGVCQKIIVVVGAYADSVKQVLSNYQVEFVEQKETLGTGNAVKVAISQLNSLSPTLVLVGYGDHMMFYRKETAQSLIDLHTNNNVALSLVTVSIDKPENLRWGHIVRDNSGNVIDSIEHKDADEDMRQQPELNAGLYCFNYQFLKDNIDKLEKSPVSGEYYLNGLVKIAADQGLAVKALPVSFEEVGIGVNTKDQLGESQELFSKLQK